MLPHFKSSWFICDCLDSRFSDLVWESLQHQNPQGLVAVLDHTRQLCTLRITQIAGSRLTGNSFPEYCSSHLLICSATVSIPEVIKLPGLTWGTDALVADAFGITETAGGTGTAGDCLNVGTLVLTVVLVRRDAPRPLGNGGVPIRSTVTLGFSRDSLGKYIPPNLWSVYRGRISACCVITSHSGFAARFEPRVCLAFSDTLLARNYSHLVFRIAKAYLFSQTELSQLVSLHLHVPFRQWHLYEVFYRSLYVLIITLRFTFKSINIHNGLVYVVVHTCANLCTSWYMNTMYCTLVTPARYDFCSWIVLLKLNQVIKFII